MTSGSKIMFRTTMFGAEETDSGGPEALVARVIVGCKKIFPPKSPHGV
jgi:hypothetical protein